MGGGSGYVSVFAMGAIEAPSAFAPAIQHPGLRLGLIELHDTSPISAIRSATALIRIP